VSEGSSGPSAAAVAVKPGRHREATLYHALAGAGAGDGRTLAELRAAAAKSFEDSELPVWRRSGFWTTSLQDLELDALELRAPAGAPGAQPDIVTRTLPERPRAGRLVQSAGAVVHVAMIVVFFALAGHDLTKAFKLPSGSKILLVLAVIIALIGVVLATRPGRRWTRKKLIPGARSAAGSLRQAAASPVKLGLLFGGSALITLAYIAALAASVQAFGGGPGLVVLGAVYLAAAALAAAAPTPGGLGAIEAALVAGLTGVGMQPGPAVSAVLLYRLATYWLPVLPGWLSWRSLQRRGYV